MVIRASAGLIDGAEIVVGAGGGAITVGSGETPGAVDVEETTVVVLVVAVVSARVPSVVTRRTMSTPLRPSAPASFSAACCRKNSIASRILASLNSTRGMMIV